MGFYYVVSGEHAIRLFGIGPLLDGKLIYECMFASCPSIDHRRPYHLQTGVGMKIVYDHLTKLGVPWWEVPWQEVKLYMVEVADLGNYPQPDWGAFGSHAGVAIGQNAQSNSIAFGNTSVNRAPHRRRTTLHVNNPFSLDGVSDPLDPENDE